MTLVNVFKAAGLVAAGIGFGIAAEKVSAAKKEKNSEEVADEVTTEDFESEVAKDSEEE